MTIQNGQNKGEQYQMISARLSIGRAPENDIILQDAKCSRNHGVLEFDGSKLIYHHLSSNQYSYVNEQMVQSSILQNLNILKIGETEILIKIFDVAKNPIFDSSNYANENIQAYPTNNKNPNAKSGIKAFHIILFSVIAFGAYLFLSETKKNKEAEIIRDDSIISAEIESLEKSNEELKNSIATSGKSSAEYILAQEAYLKGFREMREGNYLRAISEFQAALSIYPKHELARKYYFVSKRKLDQVVQENMNLARQYTERKQFKAAMGAYKNVMVLLNDPNNPIFKEAKLKYEECTLLLNGAL